MVAQAATSIARAEPVSLDEQKFEVVAATSYHINETHSQLSGAAPQAALETQQKYNAERQKRRRSDGNAQNVDFTFSGKFKHYRDDPWLVKRSKAPTISDSEHVKYPILGSGCGGPLHAVKLIEPACQHQKHELSTLAEALEVRRTTSDTLD